MVKQMTFEEFIAYRNKIITRMNARNKHFKKIDNQDSYYEIRLKEINDMYPEFNKLGHITLKKRF